MLYRRDYQSEQNEQEFIKFMNVTEMPIENLGVKQHILKIQSENETLREKIHDYESFFYTLQKFLPHVPSINDRII